MFCVFRREGRRGTRRMSSRKKLLYQAFLDKLLKSFLKPRRSIAVSSLSESSSVSSRVRQPRLQLGFYGIMWPLSDAPRRLLNRWRGIPAHLKRNQWGTVPVSSPRDPGSEGDVDALGTRPSLPEHGLGTRGCSQLALLSFFPHSSPSLTHTRPWSHALSFEGLIC